MVRLRTCDCFCSRYSSIMARTLTRSLPRRSMRPACGSSPLAILAERFLGHGARLLSAKHRPRPEQQPPTGPGASVLDNPAAQYLTTGTAAEPVAETPHGLVPDDMIGLADRQSSAATPLAVSFTEGPFSGLGKPWESRRLSFGGRCWCRRTEQLARKAVVYKEADASRHGGSTG